MAVSHSMVVQHLPVDAFHISYIGSITATEIAVIPLKSGLSLNGINDFLRVLDTEWKRPMKHSSILSIAIAITLLFLIGVGGAMATTTTTGSMTDSASLVWTTSTDGIDGVLVPGELQSTTVYGENTQAYGGKSIYSRSFDLNTGAMTYGQYNVESMKMFSFNGTSPAGSGRATSDEIIGIDTMGMPGTSTGFDPFCTPTSWPAFHNTVSAGSTFDLEQGAILTQGNTRTVTSRPDIPVALNYQVDLQGLDNKPAVGSAGSFMDGHLEQGIGNTTAKGMDLVFSDKSTASGLISTFNKVMDYESGSTISIV
jgi:hypothetical protein